MRKFTKSILALALLMVGATSVKAEKVYSIDYSTLSSFPFYVMGFEPICDGNAMIDADATGWHQYFIADQIPTVLGGDYVVKALVRSSADLTFAINMGWGWGAGESVSAGVTIPKSSDFVEVEWRYKDVGGTSCNLVAQPWSNPTIEWKSLAVYTADAEPLVIYGDLAAVTPKLYAKNGTDGVIIEDPTPDANGVYVVESHDNPSAAWDTQLWIGTTEPGLPAGQKFHLKFDYKADAAAHASTQTHGGTAGPYIIWHCIGDVNFTDEWQTFDQDVDISADMAGWQSVAFNLNESSGGTPYPANKYYFRNIELKVPEITGEMIEFTVGNSWYATFSSDKAVSLGSAPGYKAHFNGSYVELTPVSEVPANTAVIIEGAGKYAFDVIASAADLTDNDLLISDGSVEGDGTVYVLANKNDNVGFYRLADGDIVPAGKAYLTITTPAPEFVGFGGATGIETVKTAKANGEFFNLAGQRVAQPTKGLYIVNGKKVVFE